jgi:hypothetical protein
MKAEGIPDDMQACGASVLVGDQNIRALDEGMKLK